MPDPAPEDRLPATSVRPSQALQPRDLSEEWDEPLRQERLASVHRASSRVRSLYSDGEPLRERLHEPGIWMLVGLPASGKSTFARELERLGREVVGIDSVREEAGLEFGTPGWQEEAYRLAYRKVEALLPRGVVFDSTGLWEPARERCRRLAREHQLPVRALVVATDPEVARPRELERRPEEPLFVRVLDVYAEVLEELPREGYSSLHWLPAHERERLVAAWDEARG